jgi:hypothetical protein
MPRGGAPQATPEDQLGSQKRWAAALAEIKEVVWTAVSN